MHENFQSLILQSTGATSFTVTDAIQDLWSGYGKIIRVHLENASAQSAVIKHVHWPTIKNHPRGWNSDLGHQRKLKSYQVETTWYQEYSEKSQAQLPHCYAFERQDDEVLMVLEDLDASGFPLRKSTLQWHEIEAVLTWLAKFHASYLGQEPTGLWEVGTYWHLETRPQELAALSDQRLKEAALAIDEKLNSCQFKTFVHGDAKLANFCFAQDGAVAGLDFQYVGGGCGMKDVAYFIGSCLNEKECERLEGKILDSYFEKLQGALPERHKDLENEWRSLYRLAWADFHRFLKGWSPGHWKINSYSERLTAEVIKNL
tara:strand:+ start:1400 stop:2347 length:948 start_codon:yes stop_codon:yes gene_type:complete